MKTVDTYKVTSSDIEESGLNRKLYDTKISLFVRKCYETSYERKAILFSV